jgi:hypothetical protein
MPDLGGLQFPPPRSWEDFEDFCVDLFAAEWRGIQRHGRSGQRQRGVDIFGQLPNGSWAAIQCKRGKVWPPARLSLKEVERDIAAARTFEPPLGLFVVATTMEADAKLQALARRVTQEHSREGLSLPRFPGHLKRGEDVAEKGVQDGTTISRGVSEASG